MKTSENPSTKPSDVISICAARSRRRPPVARMSLNDTPEMNEM